MFSIPLYSLAWMPHETLVIPAVGGAVCVVAFLVGRRFLAVRSAARPMDLDELSDDGLLQGVTKDRRARPRRTGNEVGVDLANDADDTVQLAWVLNRSAGGLNILTEKSVPEGTVLRVRPHNGPTTNPWIEIIVRSCRKDVDQFELGCQFKQPPNYNHMLMFG